MVRRNKPADRKQQQQPRARGGCAARLVHEAERPVGVEVGLGARRGRPCDVPDTGIHQYIPYSLNERKPDTMPTPVRAPVRTHSRVPW